MRQSQKCPKCAGQVFAMTKEFTQPDQRAIGGRETFAAVTHPRWRGHGVSLEGDPSVLLPIDVVLLAVAGLASMILILRGREARRLAKARTQVALAESGIQASGNLLGASEARFPDGVTVALTNGAFHTRPGTRCRFPILCMARIAVPLADQIVCKASEAVRVVGAVPAVPRVRTGYARFDDAYAVFVGVSGGRPAGSYRAAIAEGDTPWAQAPVLDGFLDLRSVLDVGP